LAQLRQDYDQFLERGVALLVIGPENAQKFSKYFTQNQLPFPGLPDPERRILKLFGQEIKIFKLGRMPAQILIDKQGIARYVYFGNAMSDIPSSRELLDLLA
jgi:peroxiredoxin Q/BCP